jgi:hypothetical protein
MPWQLAATDRWRYRIDRHRNWRCELVSSCRCIGLWGSRRKCTCI